MPEHAEEPEPFGLDGLPVGLMNYSGAPVLRMLTHFLNTVYESGCIPACRRQSMSIHAYKKADTSDSGSCRSLAIMSCVDKLFAALLTQRLMAAVPLHDQQHGCCLGLDVER